ncbi:methyltransferase domain-containing protein [Methyloligella sp. 2.7D]|uniref:methyltransferase domain-containing protein n=1 Tax=unclassified Methyloligella TaxID=2625955 RepID=UPI00157CD524|nr:methyltransferase domain-containing protein [Methyloligella sp. GL2]QKP76163.1 methyltransferase domain-containing protein [Methyloligella sp. GL2]
MTPAPTRHDDTEPDGYVHARDMAEYERLRKQARVWEAATRQVLGQAGLMPGMRCLDVGAGPGAVMQIMAEGAGPKGTVTGLEIDGALAGQALERLQRSNGSQYRMITGDINALSDLDGAPFDLSFCRLFLMHMADPVAVLKKMAGWTKPGGVVVAQEFDFISLSVTPACPAMDEFLRVFEGVFEAHGRSRTAGRDLPAQFEAAGIGTPEGTDAAVKFLPLSEMAPMLIAVYQSLYDHAAKLGLLDEARARRFVEEMTEAARDRSVYCLTPTLIAAWKRCD